MSACEQGMDPAEIEHIGRKAWKAASRSAKHMSKHSKIVNPSLEKCIPRFERNEVILGDFLGSGGFNDVYEVEKIALITNLEDAEHAKKIASPLQREHRAFLAKHVFRESSQNCRYAMKFLSIDTICDPNRYITGAADLVVEAKFLASLEHPNIIKLRGMAAAGTSGFAKMEERGYFLLLDRLQCTLEDRIDQWKDVNEKLIGSSSGEANNNNNESTDNQKRRDFLAERLHVAFDVCAALDYLHNNHIIYRDLKPVRLVYIIYIYIYIYIVLLFMYAHGLPLLLFFDFIFIIFFLTTLPLYSLLIFIFIKTIIQSPKQ